MDNTVKVEGETVEPLGPGQARVASSTSAGHWYTVDLNGDQACQCRGYEVRGDCRHVKLVEKYDGRWPGMTKTVAPAQTTLLAPAETKGDDELIPFSEKTTVGGHKCGEVASALQKTIRRGLQDEALFWATELDLSGYGNYAWKRLRTITSEDVGLAWMNGPAVIRALQDNWLEEKKAAGKDAKPGCGMLYLAHAVLLLSQSAKSRIVDNACNLFYGHRELVSFEIPDYALDSHTGRGRRMGRTEENHYEESYGVAHQTLEDPYLGPAHPWMGDEQIARLAAPHDLHPSDEFSRVEALDEA